MLLDVIFSIGPYGCHALPAQQVRSLGILGEAVEQECPVAIDAGTPERKLAVFVQVELAVEFLSRAGTGVVVVQFHYRCGLPGGLAVLCHGCGNLLALDGGRVKFIQCGHANHRDEVACQVDCPLLGVLHF